MNGLTAFKNEIFKYGIIVAAIVELASLPFLGPDVQFLYGLILGTAISIVNFNLMEITFKRALVSKSSVIAFVGYLIRLVLYGGAFYMAMKVSNISGLASLLGFMTLKAAIYYLHGFKAKFSTGRKVRPEVQAEYERMDAAKAARKKDTLWNRLKSELEYQEDTSPKVQRTYRRRKLSHKYKEESRNA